MTGLEPLWLEAAKGLTGLAIKTFGEMANKRLDEPFQQAVYNFFGRYIQNYLDRHGILRVLGMPEPVRLQDIYTDVQFLGEDGLRRYSSIGNLEEAYRSEMRRFQSERSPKQDGMQAANNQQYLMVLGQPGAGKSTFLRRVGLEALMGHEGDYRHECIPVFVELKRFNTAEINVEKAIAQELENCGFPDAEGSTKKLLAKGKLLILLDGLDEVPTAQLDQAITQIQDFVDRHKQNRFIASCRTAAYHSRFRQFKDVVMADFDDAQIQQFITNWFQSEQDKQFATAQKCWGLLQQPEYAATKELAQTPLLLTLLCLVFDDSQAFPKNRAVLYGDALDVLLKKWASEKRIQRDPIYKDLSVALEEMMLGEIAYAGFVSDRLFFSSREVVKQIYTFLESNLNAPKHLDGEEVLKAIQIQQGILVERAADVLSFSHLTIQEYLVAQHIADHNLIEELVAENIANDRWREVFQLVAGLMRGGADALLLRMELEAQKYLNTDKLKSLVNWADQATADSEGNFKPAAKRAIAIFFPLALALAFAPNFGFAHELTFALAPDLAFSLTSAFTFANTRPSTLVRALALEFKEAKVFNSVDFVDLISQVEALESQAPDDSPPYEIRRAFVDRILQTWHIALNIHPQSLTLVEEEVESLNNYFYTNELIIRCKEAAARVSPKTWEAIESRMLTVRA
ncbi:NACHT domain-containing protein [Phormidesmis priestleyi]